MRKDDISSWKARKRNSYISKLDIYSPTIPQFSVARFEALVEPMMYEGLGRRV
jgi:hypothetical protein